MTREELEQAYKKSEEERQKIASYLKNGAVIPSINETTEITKEILKETGSKYNLSNASSLLLDRFAELATGMDKNGNSLTPEKIESKIKRNAKSFLEASEITNDSLFNESANLRKTIRSSEITVGEAVIDEFGGREEILSSVGRAFLLLYGVIILGLREANP